MNLSAQLTREEGQAMMVLSSETEVQRRLERWGRFMRGTGPQVMFKILHNPMAQERPLPWPNRKAERVEHAWQTYEQAMARLEWLQDDAVPCLSPYTGTEIFAAAFGCEVEYPDDTMPFALPMVQSAVDVATLRVPSLDHPQLALVFEIADELRRRAPQAIMQLPDIQSPMDIAALIWDKNDLYCAMAMEPQAVLDLVAMTRELLTTFLDEWFRRYGTTYIAHYPHYPMEGGLTLSEDEVGAVNSEMFRTFFRPSLVRLSEQFGGIGIHCCANSRHQWDNFKALPGLRLLNIAQPPDVTHESLDFFSPEIVNYPSNCECFAGEPWTWPAQLPAGARAVFDLPAENRDEAVSLAGKMAEIASD